MSKDTSGPAFPYEERTRDGQPYRDYFGMTLRDYFAAKALQGILAGQHPITKEADVFYVASKVSYEFADAMLKARES